MPKNIVICSDGTGNSGGKKRGTNVWRIYNAVNRYRTDVPQITFYDDGVGTDTLRWARSLGGAFGWGLSRNVRQLYAFLVMNYEPDDKIFLFGFSRGAFTVRSLAGMIIRCGLLKREHYLQASLGKRNRMLKQILRAYRSESKEAGERMQNLLALQPIEIEFIGVWDTVDAVGLPFDELRGLDWGWRKLFGVRLWGFHDRRLSRKVKYGYQALAIDDERRTFHPNVWKPREGIEQVWFAGVHSNVGGGYPKDAMSFVPLDWMMGNAEAHGLGFIEGRRDEFGWDTDVHGRLYDSRGGLGAFYRYAARNLGTQPAIHASVFERIARGTDNYAPKVITERLEGNNDLDQPNYTVAWTDKGPYASTGTTD